MHTELTHKSHKVGDRDITHNQHGNRLYILTIK